MPKPFQLNISPLEDSLKMLDELVERYGSRHKAAKNRNTIAAEVLDQFLPVWAEMLARKDKDLQDRINTILQPTKSR